MNFYCIVYKPFNVLSQFTSQDGKQTLKDFFDVPPDVYPVGRLDYDSEGLLVLTNDKKLNQQLLNPLNAHEREYWVQVDGAVTQQAMTALQLGVSITVDGKAYRTKPSKVALIEKEPKVPDRNPPIRVRKKIPTSWIKIKLTEGKNRQVRKMTAAVGFPTVRLIRYRIGQCNMEDVMPGDMIIYSQKEINHLLFK